MAVRLYCACVLTCLVALCQRAVAGESARDLLSKASDYVASASSIQRVDVTETSSTMIIGQTRLTQPPQRTEVTIEIDRPRHLARRVTSFQGKELVLLKQDERAAMKLGLGPWEVPAGPFEQMARDIGNLFVCEIETPETEQNAPVWKLVGTEPFAGQDAHVIETEGNSAIAIAQERMAKGIARMFEGKSEQVPTVKVLEYSARHWIRKSDHRHLQAVQRSKFQITVPIANLGQQVIEQSTRGTSTYQYENRTIDVPAEAQKILSASKPRG